PATLALDHVLPGQAAFDARNKAEAVRHFEAALHVEPAHYWSLLYLGYCLCDLGEKDQDFAVAAVAFTGCILKRPDHAHAYFCRGLAYEKMRLFQQAEAEFREALRLERDHFGAHASLGYVLGVQGKYAEAEPELREALRLGPNQVQVQYNLGRALN